MAYLVLGSRYIGLVGDGRFSLYFRRWFSLSSAARLYPAAASLAKIIDRHRRRAGRSLDRNGQLRRKTTTTTRVGTVRCKLCILWVRWLVTQHLSVLSLYYIPSCPYIPSQQQHMLLVDPSFRRLVPPHRTSRIYTATGSERDQSRHEALQDADEQWGVEEEKKRSATLPACQWNSKKEKGQCSEKKKILEWIYTFCLFFWILFFLYGRLNWIPLMEKATAVRRRILLFPRHIFGWQRCSISDVSLENGPCVSLSRHFVSRPVPLTSMNLFSYFGKIRPFPKEK